MGPTWARTEDGRWLIPERSLGWDVIDWCELWLLQPDGPDAGEPWRFTKEQKRFLLWWYAVDDRGRFKYRSGMLRRMKGWGKDPFCAAICCAEFLGPCRFVGWDEKGEPQSEAHYAATVQIAAVSQDQVKRNTMSLFPAMFSARAIQEYELDIGKEIIWAHKGRCRIEMLTASARSAEGPRPTFIVKNEALALDTPLPTPEGWTTVGDVQPGDTLYGSTGPVSVVKVTPVYEGRPCYRVTFEDGTSLVADEGHLWLSKPVSSAAKPSVRTTRQMVEDGRRFSVPLVTALDSPDQDLLLDPYLLGYWLGDGDSQSAIIAVGDEDVEALEGELSARGYNTVRCLSKGAPRLSVTMDGARRNRNDPRPLGVRGRLAALGVLGNKHVPDQYMRGSLSQRLDLLRGLMDSDGCVTASQSQAIFVNQNKRLADSVVELARSVGYRVSMAETTDERWPEVKIGWRVIFRAAESANPFKLARKADAVHGERRAWKTIRSIEPVESVPVKCIEVDSDDHLFVAGDGWSLTHNTQHWIPSNGGIEMSEVCARNVAKSRDGSARTLAISNAHAPGELSDAESDYEAAMQGDPGFMYDSIEASDAVVEVLRLLKFEKQAEREQERLRGILRAELEWCRGDSIWLDIDRLRDECLAPKTRMNEALRFYFNRLAASDERAFDMARWKALARPMVDGKPYRPAPGSQICLGFDGSQSDDWTVLMAVDIRENFLWPVGIWVPEQEADGRWRINVADVMATVDYAFQTWDVVRMFCDPSDWGEQIHIWAGRYNGADGKRIWELNPRRDVARMALATREFMVAVEAGELRHDGDDRVTWAVGNTYQTEINITDGSGEQMVRLSKERRMSPLKIDPVIGAILAEHGRAMAIAEGLLEENAVEVFWIND